MCGIYGFSSSQPMETDEILKYVKLLQHRGKDGYGYITESEYVRHLGVIKSINSKRETKQLVAHTRYTTSGLSRDVLQLHPIKHNDLYMVHNGNIPNIDDHDTKYLLSLCDPDNIVESLIKIINTIPAAYCFLLYTHEAIYMVRDIHGIRPLSYCKYDESIYIASESCALPYDPIFVPAGSIHRVSGGHIELVYQHPAAQESLCAFEIFYLMNPISKYYNMSIGDIRKNLGKKLAEYDNFDESYEVVGVPKSGLMAAEGYASHLDLDTLDAITLVNEDRSFITTQDERKMVCHKKFNFNPKLIKDKKIILIDDTIVRGTVLKEIVGHLYSLGAKEIHVRIPAPPIVDICIFGISIRKRDELLMNNYSLEEIIAMYNLSSLRYLSFKDLSQVIGFPKNSYMKPFGIEFN